jgi:DNA-binding FrmR family transcriptional regulator
MPDPALTSPTPPPDSAHPDAAGADRAPAPTTAGPGYAADKRAVLARLRRVEGQVRGITRMIEEDRYCIEVLDQVSAVTRALQAVALQLVDDHLGHCVADAVTAGGDQAAARLAEASAAIARLVRS